MNYYEHHIGDYIKNTAHLSMLEDGCYRRMIDAYYTREAPLPEDKKACYRLVRASSREEKVAVDVILAEFFVLESDGWHQKRCDSEIAKYSEKKPVAEEKRENDKERQKRARERRKALFEALSSHGINMPWNATTDALHNELSRVTACDESRTCHGPVTPPVTRDNTATQTPDTRHQSPDVNQKLLAHAVSPEYSRAQNPDSEPTTTTAGLLCRRIRDIGIADGNPSHPRLLALLAGGITPEEIESAAIDAKAKGKGFAYVLGVAEGRRRDASNVAALPAAQQKRSEAGEASGRAMRGAI